jgi:hypothetical protein
MTGIAYSLLMGIYLPLTSNRSNMLLNLVSGNALTHHTVIVTLNLTIGRPSQRLSWLK